MQNISRSSLLYAVTSEYVDAAMLKELLRHPKAAAHLNVLDWDGTWYDGTFYAPRTGPSSVLGEAIRGYFDRHCKCIEYPDDGLLPDQLLLKKLRENIYVLIDAGADPFVPCFEEEEEEETSGANVPMTLTAAQYISTRKYSYQDEDPENWEEILEKLVMAEEVSMEAWARDAAIDLFDEAMMVLAEDEDEEWSRRAMIKLFCNQKED